MSPTCISRPQIPVELLLDVVSFYMESLPLRGRPWPKPAWALVEPVSLVCHVLRRATLKAWFRTLCVRDKSDLLAIQRDWPELHRWVRAFVCIFPDPNDDVGWDLGGFDYLDAICVQMSTGVHDYPFTRFINVPQSVETLDLTGMAEAGPMQMRAVAETFPTIRTLKMQPLYTWCGLCNTNEFSSFSGEVPSLLVYEGGIGLPMHFGKFLAPLTALETFCITTVYDEHMILGDAQSPYNEIGKNENIWVGECQSCMRFLYPDDVFREGWVAKKKEPEVRLPVLKKVEWAFMTESDLYETWLLF